jgi:hypothetical protein
MAITSSLAAGAVASDVMASEQAIGQPKERLSPLIHVAYFWLKRPESQSDRDQLIAGLKTLAGIPDVDAIHIGLPASTEKRDVVDNSFHASEVILFRDIEAQNRYQAHPIHQQFIKDCEHLWERVVVHDSLAV